MKENETEINSNVKMFQDLSRSLSIADWTEERRSEN